MMATDRKAQASPAGGVYVSPREFARLSGLSLATIHRYVKCGKLPCCQPGGRRARLLIPIDALQGLALQSPSTERAPAAQVSPMATAPIRNELPGPTRLAGPVPRWMRSAPRPAG